MDLIEKLGLPVAIVVACAYFFVKKWWPLTVRQLDEARDITKEAVAAIAGIKDVLLEHAAVSHQQVTVSQQIVERLKELQINAGTDARVKRR